MSVRLLSRSDIQLSEILRALEVRGRSILVVVMDKADGPG